MTSSIDIPNAFALSINTLKVASKAVPAFEPFIPLVFNIPRIATVSSSLTFIVVAEAVAYDKPSANTSPVHWNSFTAPDRTFIIRSPFSRALISHRLPKVFMIVPNSSDVVFRVPTVAIAVFDTDSIKSIATSALNPDDIKL